MTRLVRTKFQHLNLTAQLIATGDGRLVNGQGRNWLGSILEFVRAELVEQASF